MEEARLVEQRLREAGQPLGQPIRLGSDMPAQQP
jgi:hypothetical protein